MISTPCSLQDYWKLNHMAKSFIQPLHEFCQAWDHDHFLGDPVPMTDHTLSEEPFPNVQAYLPLLQLPSISSNPIIRHQREEISISPSTVHLEEVFDCDEITPSLKRNRPPVQENSMRDSIKSLDKIKQQFSRLPLIN